MAYTAAGRHPLLWYPEAEIDLTRSICLRGMLQYSRDSLLGKVREVRWRVITAEMRGWGWGFSLRSLKLQWESSIQPRLEEVLNEGTIQVPHRATREQRIALLAGPQLSQIDGVSNNLLKPPEPTPFCGNEDETAVVPQTADANNPGTQTTQEGQQVPPEVLGMTMEIQNAMLAKFRQFTIEEMLGARALMTEILDAFNRSCEAAVQAGMHPGPVYHMRNQLHWIHHAWSLVMDGYRPLTKQQHDGIIECEKEEASARNVHCYNNQRFREWRLRGWLPPMVPFPEQQGLQHHVPPPPTNPATDSSSSYINPFKIAPEPIPLGNGYPSQYQAQFPGDSASSATWLGGAVQQPALVKAKKQPKTRTEMEDDDGFWDETESVSPKEGTKKRAKKQGKEQEEQKKEQEEKREKQNHDRQERAARRLRKKEGLELS